MHNFRYALYMVLAIWFYHNNPATLIGPVSNYLNHHQQQQQQQPQEQQLSNNNDTKLGPT